MASLIHILVCLVCGFECVVAMQRASAQVGRLVMFAPIGLIHGVVPLLAPPEGWPREDLEMAAQMALLGVVAFSVGWRWYERSSALDFGNALAPGLALRLQDPLIQRALGRLCIASAVLGVLAWLGSMITTAGSISAAWNAGRFEYRGSGNVTLAVLLSHGQMSLTLLPGFLCFFLSRRYRVFGTVFTLTMAILLYVGTQGARGTSIGLVVGLGIGYALTHRVGKVQIAVALLGGTVLMLLASGLYEARKVMSDVSVAELVRILTTSSTYEGMLTRDPLNYHDVLVAAVYHFPSHHEFLDGATYRRLLVFFVPRSYAPWLKPPDTNLIFASVVTGLDEGVTIPPTIMGDGYINFWGWPGVILTGVLNGWLFSMVTHRMRGNILWFLGIGGTFGRVSVMSIRGQPYEIVTGLVSAILLTGVLGYLVGLPIRTLIREEFAARRKRRQQRTRH